MNLLPSQHDDQPRCQATPTAGHWDENGDVFPLSYMQESLWLVEQITPGNSAYNLPEAWRCRGIFNMSALQQSLDAIVQRHEILRTRFGVRDGRPVQIIDPPAPFDLRVTSLIHGPNPECEVQRWLEAEARVPFDLVRGPLARARVLRLDRQDHVLLLNLHHIIADEWSFTILRRELTELYGSALNGERLCLPELPIQYADFAAWQRERVASGALDEHLDFWRHELRAPLPGLDLPTDYPRPSVQSLRGATRFQIVPRQLLEELKQLGRAHGATLFMTLLAAFQALLRRYARQTDLMVGCPIAGRDQAETEGLIGFLVNTHALRCDASDDPPFLDFLGRVRAATLNAKAHQELPLDKILQALEIPRDPGRHPLFQVVFGFQGTLTETWSLAGVEAARVEVDNGGAKFDWTLLASETSQGLRLRCEYRTDLFEPSTVARFARHFETLLAGIVSRPEARLSALPLLNRAEEQQAISALNAAPAESAPGPCLPDWFAEKAARAPEAIAVNDEHHRLTYRELDARSNQLAHLLQGLGVGPEVPVALCLDRSIDLVVACLGVLKAGGVYVPIDPTIPTARLGFILQDTQARVFLTQRNLRENLKPAMRFEHAPEVVCLDADGERLDAQAATRPACAITPANTAYIIYTSGSTGQPKGVLVTHYNVVRLLQQTQPWFHFNETDVWTLFHSYTFDFSVWELWGALLFGGRLVIVPYLVSRSPADFLALLARERVTVLNQTPSAFRQLMWVDGSASAPPDLHLRYIIFGGEALELQSFRPWFERHGDQKPVLVNMYGITETTVHVTYRIIKRADLEAALGSVIGVPIPDLRLYLLDERLRPVPPGVPGELCVGGAGVARGYLNRNDLTAQRFVADPWSAQAGARLYRSGDLARVTAGGELEYLGRMDQQVKIRGFRVELGEIESALNRHCSVRESVVIANDFGGDRRLVAYVVPKERAPTPEEFREHLAQSLPDYMIPAVFILLEALPLTVNGKVERRGLPWPAQAQLTRSQLLVPPRNETEELIAGVWCQVLGQKAVGVHDNFFHLGGHSLLASQVMARLTAAFNLDLPVRLLFEAPTIAGLAQALARVQREQPERPSAIPSRVLPAQARELLARIDELSEEEIEGLLRQGEGEPISA